MEAKAAGVVPICADGGDVHRTVKNYYDGLLFKKASSKDLVRCLREIYGDFDLYKRLRKNALKEAKLISRKRQAYIIKEIVENWNYNK